jgi:hypothetical protein
MDVSRASAGRCLVTKAVRRYSGTSRTDAVTGAKLIQPPDSDDEETTLRIEVRVPES